MIDPQYQRIIDEKFQKYIPSKSETFFQCGVIIAVSLLLGVIYFQYVEVPPELSDKDAKSFRFSLGMFLGSIIAVVVMLGYILRRLWRGRKAMKEAQAEILAVGLEQLKK